MNPLVGMSNICNNSVNSNILSIIYLQTLLFISLKYKIINPSENESNHIQ